MVKKVYVSWIIYTSFLRCETVELVKMMSPSTYEGSHHQHSLPTQGINAARNVNLFFVDRLV